MIALSILCLAHLALTLRIRTEMKATRRDVLDAIAGRIREIGPIEAQKSALKSREPVGPRATALNI